MIMLRRNSDTGFSLNIYIRICMSLVLQKNYNILKKILKVFYICYAKKKLNLFSYFILLTPLG